MHAPFPSFFLLALLALSAITVLHAARADDAPLERDPTLSPMRSIIEHEAADLGSLQHRYGLPLSDSMRERLRRFYEDELSKLAATDFDSLDPAGRIDYVLLQHKLRFELKQLEYHRRQFAAVAGLLPFADAIVRLEEARQRVEPVDPEQCARTLQEIEAQAGRIRGQLEEQLKTTPPSAGLPSRVLANRAAELADRLRATLKDWNEFYTGYDPLFTWWVREPYPKLDKRLGEYADFLRKRLAGFDEGNEGKGGTDAKDAKDEPVIGDPIGREALLDALSAEMIPYTPEELIDLAEHEFVWCEAEMKRTARDLGCGDDWHKALDKVGAAHIKPGEQPQLIKQLADEAVKFVEDRDLLTIPPLCKESWRMEMMSPERQKVNPYFTGGDVISVSYPTDAMSFDDKLMSMRGNNPAFCRATVFHELIPGHHLQAFMARRYNAHRREFTTPFLVEGWALYWEMRMWDLGFPRTPEERAGMVFWRAHRCARIIFSLKFHLGQMTAPQAIDFLVERVGHERRNATAEVRRSVNGSYPPLYQAAYLLGGMQLRSLHKELIGSHRMTERQFHDAILRENAIPVELIRASLTGQKLARDFKSTWRFYDEKGLPAADPKQAGPGESEPRRERR